MADEDTASKPENGTVPPPEPTVCRRCGARTVVDDDGFCERCEKTIEQACL